MTAGSKSIGRTSKRKRAEPADPEQLRLAETVFDDGVSCIAILDREFNFVRVNAAYARACRRDIGDFPGRNHFDLYPSDAKPIFEDVVRTGTRFETFARAFTFSDQPDRGVTYWDWTLIPVIGRHDEVEYLVFSLNDVTERIQAEESLRESEQELRAIFEGTLDGILVADGRTRMFLAANAAICGMLGYAREEILRIGVADIHPRQDLPRVMAHFEALVRGETQMLADVPILRKDGSVGYADIKASTIRLRGQDCMLGVFRDTTERRLAEAELHERENRVGALVDATSDGFWVLDRTGRILEVNDKYLARSGYSREELVGKRVFELDADQSTSDIEASLAKSGHQGSRIFETRHRARDGSAWPVEISTIFNPEAGGRYYSFLRDISERKLTEQKLREGETRFRALVEQAGDGFELCDEQGRIIDVNAAACAQLGYSREEMLSLTVYDLAPNMTRERYLRGFELPASTSPERFEATHRRKDGTILPVEVTRSIVQLGTRRLAFSLVRDITQRKRAELEMAQLAAIVESSSDAIIRRAMDDCIVSWNPAAERLFGYAASETIGRKAHELIVPTERMGEIDRSRALIAQGQAVPDFETVRRTKDGRLIDVSLSQSPIKDRRGRLAGVSVIFRDITERKRSEQALRAAEEQFRGLVEKSIAGIYIVQDGKFVYLNPRFAEIHGYDSVDELIGREPQMLVCEADRDKTAENFRQLMQGEMPALDYSVTGLRRDGTTVEVGGHGARASYRGRPAIIGMMQDISDKKRAEEQIQRYVAQLKTAFLSTVEVATTLSELRDPYTAGHERRVAEIAVAIGTEFGFDASRLEGLRVAGYLHDVGKITIPAEILSKPGRLSEIELQLIQGHAQAGYDVLKTVDFPWPVAQIALQHHERMDGSGYPQGLKGEAILIEARITAVADVIEAMSSHRPYRPGLGIERALAEIERGRGTVYDAQVADVCLRLFREQRHPLPT